MSGIRRTSDLGTQGVKTILDGSIQSADIASEAVTAPKLHRSAGAVMVYASAAARDTAITSPTEGMLTYLQDTNTLEMYTTGWQGLDSQATAYVSNASGNADLWIRGNSNYPSTINFQHLGTGNYWHMAANRVPEGNAMALFYNNAGTWAESIRFATNGRVNMANQPKFYATRSGNATYNNASQGVPMIYNNVIQNTGNHYNGSTGLFTAPVAGNYVFECGIYASGTMYQLWPVVNGGRTSSFVLVNGGSGNICGGTSQYLNSGDTFGVASWSDGATITMYENGFHTFFRGSLIG